MIRFYAPDIEQTLTLPESDSQHCIRVLRMHIGDEIEVVDGRGRLFQCRIADGHPKRTRLEIVGRSELPKVWTPRITVGIAPTKHLDRMEWLVEKLTETGFDRLVPLLCRWSERKELKPERLERIALSAVKQSLKATMPEICPMTPLKRFIADSASIPQKFIAHCEADKPRRLLAREYRPGLPTAILIGPEGDFSPEEIALALEAGFVPVSLGDARLRTETAALAACHTFHTINMMQR